MDAFDYFMLAVLALWTYIVHVGSTMVLTECL